MTVNGERDGVIMCAKRDRRILSGGEQRLQGTKTMNFEAVQSGAADSSDDQLAAERNNALRLLGLTESPSARVPNLPDLPDTTHTETRGIVVRIGSST
jgi:hypothetical protein